MYVPTPNEVWYPKGISSQAHGSGDITYIRINGGFMYLAALIDWYSKAILSYKISNSMDVTLGRKDIMFGSMEKKKGERMEE